MTQAIISGRPGYDLRSCQRGPSDLQLEVWQVPSFTTPELKGAQANCRPGRSQAAAGGGAVLRCLKAEQVSLLKLKKGEAGREHLSEERALRWGFCSTAGPNA